MSFWYLQIFQETNEKIRHNYNCTSTRIVFVHFFRKIEDIKKAISKLTLNSKLTKDEPFSSYGTKKISPFPFKEKKFLEELKTPNSTEFLAYI